MSTKGPDETGKSEKIFVNPKNTTGEKLDALKADLGEDKFENCKNGLVGIQAGATASQVRDALKRYGIDEFVSPFWATTQWGPDGVAKPRTYEESHMPFPDLKGKKENKEEEQ